MASRKYYAIKKGRKTGIFNTWDECKAYVQGVAGAQYKSFKTYEEAENYLNHNVMVSSKNQAEKEYQQDPKCLMAYVDGSYSERDRVYSYGVVLLTEPIQTYSKANNDSNLIEYRNVAGEILGAMMAMKYAQENDYKRVVIYHDYEGISKWPQLEWRAKNSFTQEYVKYVDSIRQHIEIRFEKVVAHTGNTYNELADSLAKKAIISYVKKDYSKNEETVEHEGKSLKQLGETSIKGGKVGLLNINFPYQGKCVSMTDIHEKFKKKCKGNKIILKNIQSLYIELKSTYDGIIYHIEDQTGQELIIDVEFEEVI